ncbi:hypothetical protein Goari_013909 [Gossypium aridum]|uniref:Uncharacterized protein n=1 Tax=Gossypium aridum TaxID=34290 RepID=A0A7J8XGR4_GOSAI|nr:hypothetical protein [Gossypium aridum]
MIWGMAMELGVGKILISCLAGRFSLKLRQYGYLQYMLGGCLFWGQEFPGRFSIAIAHKTLTVLSWQQQESVCLCQDLRAKRQSQVDSFY